LEEYFFGFFLFDVKNASYKELLTDQVQNKRYSIPLALAYKMAKIKICDYKMLRKINLLTFAPHIKAKVSTQSSDN
jgi:hypothetical protein